MKGNITLLLMLMTSVFFGQNADMALTEPPLKSIAYAQDELPQQLALVNGCTNGTMWPETAYNPLCTDNIEVINTDCWAGEYAIINYIANRQYTFMSSNMEDYITVTDGNGAVVFASGQSPVTWNSPAASGSIRYYIHKDAACGTENWLRARSIVCSGYSCGSPSNLTVSNITSDSVRLTWTPPASAPDEGYEAYITTSNIAPSFQTTGMEVPWSTFTLNTLPAATTLYYWIRSACGTTKSPWIPGGSFTTISVTGCNGAPDGLFPAATFIPSCSGNSETIAAGYAGQYSNISVQPDRLYTFKSSVSTDYITITNATGTVVYANGQTPLNWESVSNTGVVRYYLHTNASCGSAQVTRIRSVSCSAVTSVCMAPAAIYADQITGNGATLHWLATTPPSVNYEVVINTSGSTPAAGAVPTGTTTGTDPLVNILNPATTYYFWVRSNCGTVKSTWIAGGSFTTLPAGTCPGTSLYPETAYTPSCSGIRETINTDCWAGEYTYVNVQASHQYTFSSSVATDFITLFNEQGTIVYASGGSPLIWNSGAVNGTLRYLVNSSASCGESTENRTRYIKCTNIAACPVPTNLYADNMTAGTVILHWTAPSAAVANYDFAISPYETAIEDITPTNSTDNTEVLFGILSPSTTYNFWVRSNCGSGTSTWVSGGSFTTLAAGMCSSGTLYPAATFTPACTGSAETITTVAYAGEYTNVSILVNKQYTFASSVTTDHITITNSTGTIVYAKGPSPLVWNSASITGTIRYFIHAGASCEPQESNRIRSIACAAATGCPLPFSFYVDRITSASAVLHWTVGSVPSNYYDYIISTSNTPPAASSSPSGNINIMSALVASLIPSTTYYYWIRSNCGTTRTDWISGGSFMTLPPGTCPIGTPNPDGSYTPSCTGSQEIINTDCTAGDYARINAESNKQYTFASSVPTDFITVSNTEGTIIYASGTTPITWNSASVSGIVYYYIHKNNSCGMDNVNRTRYITCGTPPSCAAPIPMPVSNITSVSALLHWDVVTIPSGGYEYIVKASGTTPGTNASATGTNTMSGLTADLEPSSTYHFWVRSVCGSAKSTWAYGGTFTTLPPGTCPIGTPNPDEAFTPVCSGNQEIINTDCHAGDYAWVNIMSNKQYTFASSVSTDFITISNLNGTVIYASGVTPVIWNSAGVSGELLYFIHKNASCGSDMVNRTRYITCGTPAACPAPSGLSADEITATAAKLHWSFTGAPANGFDYIVSTSGIVPAGNATPTGSTAAAFASVNQLLPGTTYYFWVRSNCGNSKSSWVSGGSLTTAETCNTGSLFPLGTYLPLCNGTPELIADNAWAGEYTKVNAGAGKLYTFTSSVSTDFITITDAAGQLLTAGTTPLDWLSGTYSGTIRYFIHSNSMCGEEEVSRSRYITCTPVCNTPMPVAAAQVVCNGSTVDGLTATGTNIKWYNVAVNGNALTAATVLSAGNYYVSQTLNNCESPRLMVAVTVIASVTPSFASVAPICSGASLAPLPTTSTNGITGSWSPAISNTATTTYTFTPSAGQCATAVTRTITVNPAVTPSFASVAPICSGASLAPLPTTSTNGITGSWSPAISNTATTTYTFTPSSGQCASTATMMVTVNPEPVADALADVISCGPYTLPVLGSGNYFTAPGATGAQLNAGDVVSEAMTLYIHADNGICADESTFDIAIITVDNTTMLNGMTVMANQPGALYQWLDCNNGNSIMSGENGQSYTATADGNYAVIITVGNCSETSDCVLATSLSTGQHQFRNSILLYPNPAGGSFTVSAGSTTPDDITVIDNLGRIIAQYKPQSSKTTIDGSAWASGSYYVKISSGTSQTTKKLILNKD